MIEIAVALGVFGVVSYTGMNFVSSVKATKERTNEKDKHYYKTFKTNAFAREFSSMLQAAGISVDYFKLPIKVGTKNICGNKGVVGGCFVAIGKDGIIDQKESARLLTTLSGADPTKGIKFVNFFSDYGKGWSERTVVQGVGLSHRFVINELQSLRYPRALVSSKTHRYYVGWTLKSKGKANPLWFMAEDEEDPETFFEVEYKLGKVGYTRSQELPQEPLNDVTSLAKAIVDKHVLVKTKNVLDSEDIAKYKNRFYIFVYPYMPDFYFIGYVSKIQYCRKSADESSDVRQSCLDMIRMLTEPTLGGDKQKWPEEFFNNDLESEDSSKYHIFRLRLVNTVKWSPFSEGAVALQNTVNVYNWNGGSDPFFSNPTAAGNCSVSLDFEKNYSPLAPYFAPTLQIKNDGNDELPNIIKESLPYCVSGAAKKPLSPHYASWVLNLVESSPRSLYMYPVKFYKYEMKDENLYLEGITTKDDRKRRRVLNNIDGKNSRVIIARQLGTNRFSSFVYQKTEKKSDK